MSNFDSLTTPSEYITYYSNQIKSGLEQDNIQINKLGFIGFLINVLGWTQYDIKTYFDNLFKESFVSTAENNKNLYLHSSIYNYIPTQSTPSLATGTFSFNFDNLSVKSTKIYKRQVIFNDILFTVNDIPFTTNCKYVFVEEGYTDPIYYCVIHTPSNQLYIPSSSSSISVPIKNAYQYYTESEEILIPQYEYNTFYSYDFTIDEDDEQLYDLDVSVYTGEDTEDNTIDLEVKTSTFGNSDSNNVVFLSNSNNTYTLNYGSGRNGLYVPNYNSVITRYITQGSNGNISIQTDGELDSSTSYCVYSYTTKDGTPEKRQIDVSKYFEVTLDYSENGTDVLDGTELRTNIISYIQTRDNLISELDYNNILDNLYQTDLKIIFRKTNIVENIMYMFRTLRSQYNEIIKSTNINIDCLDKSSSVSNFENTITSSGQFSAGDYRYYIIASNGLEYNTAYESDIISMDDNQNCYITWDEYSNASYYMIYRKQELSDTYYYLGTTYDLEFNDNGSSYLNICNNIVDHDTNWFYNPLIYINGDSYVSPFIYKYSSILNWYTSYIINNNSLFYFTDIDEFDTTNYQYDLPRVFLNIEYSYVEQKTYLKIKTHQLFDSNITIELYSNDLSISNEEIIYNSDNNEFVYEYTNDDNVGLILDSFDLKILLYYNNELQMTFKNTSIQYVFDTQDILTLNVFSPSDTSKLILNMPVILNSLYNSSLYNRIYDFFVGKNLNNNRMLSDNLQVRFLNTIESSASYNSKVLKQSDTYSAIDIKLPLKLSIVVYIKSSSTIDYNDEQDKILIELATMLNTSTYTGTDITYYDTNIIDLVYLNRNYVKDVSVTLYDSNDVELTDGIEVLSDSEKYENITDKTDILNYYPTYWYWDTDNINITFK